jgi:hypothetical protein
MSGYRTHLRAGLGAHALLVAGGFIAVVMGAPRFVLLASGTGVPITLAGALAPDVDHPASKGYVLIVHVVPVLISGSVGVGVYQQRSLLITLAAALPLTTSPLFVAGGVYLFIILLVWRATATLIVLLRPAHRTVTHRVPTWLVVASITGGGLVVFYRWLALPYPLLGAVIHTSGLLAGVLSHLYYDGVLTDRETYVGIS